MTTPNLPGRLGAPDLCLRDDPRADPRLIAAMAPLGMDVHPPATPVTADSPLEDILEAMNVAEQGFDLLGGMLAAGSPPITGVTSTTETITGPAGNEISLYISRPTDATGPLPGIVHTHGGGMVILNAAGPGYVRWREELAATGLVVVGIEFRNGGGALGPHPFPAGLDDCVAGTRWVIEHAEQLGISGVVISGESGGGNLCIASTLRAKQEGWVSDIAGVYAQCPYISGAYANPPAELTSLFENDEYFLAADNMGAMAKAYDPSGEHATNPLAWPWHATADDLAGLPPHVVSVNQLDPLRDEGLAYAVKLAQAGVSVVSRTVNGTCHAGDCLFRDAMPEVYLATIGDIKRFADTVCG
ncbi:MAG: alpha/beta hydrolase fold domain-containing protein [Ilumatobacteraceae bacterium]